MLLKMIWSVTRGQMEASGLPTFTWKVSRLTHVQGCGLGLEVLVSRVDGLDSQEIQYF